MPADPVGKAAEEPDPPLESAVLVEEAAPVPVRLEIADVRLGENVDFDAVPRQHGPQLLAVTLRRELGTQEASDHLVLSDRA